MVASTNIYPQTYTPAMLSNNGGFVTPTQQAQQNSGINPVQLASGVSKIANPSIFNGGSVMGGFNQLNTAGAKYLGTELPGVSGTGLLGGTSATALLGGVGGGALIGSFNPLVEKKTGGQVGGAIGGGIGMAVGGPIGAVVGGFIGSTIGGQFGAGKPKPGASFDAGLGADASYNGLTKMSKHMDTSSADTTSQELTPYLNNLKSLGVKIPEGYRIGGGYGLGQGFVYYGKGTENETRSNVPNQIRYNIDDPAARNKAYSDLTYNLAKESGADAATLARVREYAPPSELVGSGNTLSPNVAVKDLNPNMANNDWAGFMKTFNQRNA